MASVNNEDVCAIVVALNKIKKKVKTRQQASARNMQNVINLMVKRRKQRDFSLWCLSLIARKPEIEQRFWVQPSKDLGMFWERSVKSWTNDKLWLNNFRMSKATFDFLCKELFHRLHHRDTKFRKAITVEKKVAICLWHLATGEDYRSIGWRFGVGNSTACEIVNQVCRGIVDVLLPQIIKWPTGERLHETVEGFLSTWGFPQCAGALDGTHIPIVAPSEYSADYYNRKGFYSIVLQAVVDHQYRFTDIYIKWPGKVHDARILTNSGLYEKGQAQILFPDVTENINDCDVPIMLVADSAYPLLPWLMTRFKDNGNLNQSQVKFNYQLSRARMVVECAFGRMKSRFRCLMKKRETYLEYLPSKVATCCVLHNLCEMREDVLQQDEIVENLNDDNNIYDMPDDIEGDAEEFRLALAAFFQAN